MAELMLGLDGLLFGRAELSGWFILGGASMAGTLTVTAAEEIDAVRRMPSPPLCIDFTCELALDANVTTSQSTLRGPARLCGSADF
jgi:hypothetical protein